MSFLQQPLYTKNPSEIKNKQKAFLEPRNAYQNKFAFRKKQTNTRLVRVNQNKDLLPINNEIQSLAWGRLLKGIYECCSYKED